jgi:hypothetical protein
MSDVPPPPPIPSAACPSQYTNACVFNSGAAIELPIGSLLSPSKPFDPEIPTPSVDACRKVDRPAGGHIRTWIHLPALSVSDLHSYFVVALPLFTTGSGRLIYVNRRHGFW